VTFFAVGAAAPNDERFSAISPFVDSPPAIVNDS